jgi:hypothetical protein
LIDLRLFGSRARGDAAPDSDFDVFVVVGDDRVSAEDQLIDIAFDEVYRRPAGHEYTEHRTVGPGSSLQLPGPVDRPIATDDIL